MSTRRWRTRLGVQLRELLTSMPPLARSHLRRYEFNFTPAQLWVMCDQAGQAAELGGAFVEVGCAWGSTTVYLQHHLATLGAEVPYICIDTFGGFTSTDVAVEREQRGKSEVSFDAFDVNSKKLFERTMRYNGLGDRVRAIEADAVTFDYHSLPPIAFALLDVDLYRPMRAALEGVWERLLPGAIVVVDDCSDADVRWDGALQAYKEFTERVGLPVDIRAEKLGLLRRS